MDLSDGLNGENPVLVRGGDHERPWSDQSAYICQVPAVGVDPPHTVAMAVNGPVVDVGFQRGSAADGRGDFDPFVPCRNPPRGCAATGDAGDAQPFRIDFRPLGKQIQAADSVEHLDPRGRVAATVPVPPSFAVTAVVEA